MRPARSLRLAQRVISGFIEAFDFAAVETLIANLQVRAKGFGRAQILDSIADGLCRRCEAPILSRLPFAGFARNSSAGAL